MKYSVDRENRIVHAKMTDFKFSNDGGKNFNENENVGGQKDSSYYDYNDNRLYEYDVACEKKWSYDKLGSGDMQPNGDFVGILLATNKDNIKSVDGYTYTLSIDLAKAFSNMNESFYSQYRKYNSINMEVNIDARKIISAKIILEGYSERTTLVMEIKNYDIDYHSTIPDNYVNLETCR